MESEGKKTGILCGIEYSVPETPWEESLGNHRVKIHIEEPCDCTIATINWRRLDDRPQMKKIIVIEEISGERVRNVYVLKITKDRGKIAFQAAVGHTNYYLYFLPFFIQKTHGYYRKGYKKPRITANPLWILKNTLMQSNEVATSKIRKKKFINANHFQARTEFDSFYPMEVPMYPEERREFLSQFEESYGIIAEQRSYPIRMVKQIPLIWFQKEDVSKLKGFAMRNEFYCFQIALIPIRSQLRDVKFDFSPLTLQHNPQFQISHTQFTCFNTHGIDIEGNPFKKTLNVQLGTIQAAWIGIDIPYKIKPGIYVGQVIVNPANQPLQKIKLELEIGMEAIDERGDHEPWRHSRLRWLNSIKGSSTKPTLRYDPISREGNNFTLTDTTITLADNGLPKSIQKKGAALLTEGISFEIGENSSGLLERVPYLITEESEGSVMWQSRSDNGKYTCVITGSLEFDGYLHYKIRIEAKSDIKLKNPQLVFKFFPDNSGLFMGMGHSGGVTPDHTSLKWRGPHNSFWIGSENIGIQCKLLGADYTGPLLNLYHPKPPESWHNKGKGKITLTRSPLGQTVLKITSGKRKLERGTSIDFEFSLLITPVKTLEPKKQFIQRYFHSTAEPTSDELEAGIKVINIHHANEYNPYINYPFITPDKAQDLINNRHAKGLRVKWYYTVRELTNHVTELWALRSLGDEILTHKKGHGIWKGYPWLREHLRENYGPAWYAPLPDETVDAALITSAESRWFNYYIEGLAYMVKHYDIDGLYLDDVSYDRRIVQRMRRVMDDLKPGCLVDLHSNTAFSKGPAVKYAEFFPYIDKVWFGESFKYNSMDPEQWLVESSGIPFGHMGDMLQGGGNRWLGMLFGMTVRLPWYNDKINAEPRPVWKIWDDFEIENSQMIGFWDKSCPVKSSDAGVLITIYKKKDKILLALGNWENTSKNVEIIWLEPYLKEINLKREDLEYSCPPIIDFQAEEHISAHSKIYVKGKRGKLLVLQLK